MSTALTPDTSLFGWELTYESVKNDIKNKEDLLFVFIHWALIKAHFRCVGIGESIEECESNISSEILPPGWNTTDNYALRYMYKGKLYNLSMIKNSDGIVIVNILHKGKKISSIDVDIKKYIYCLNGSINDMLPNYKDFFFKVDHDLIIPITDDTSSHQSTQTTSLERESQTTSNQERRSNPLFYELPPMVPNQIDPFADIRQESQASSVDISQQRTAAAGPSTSRSGRKRRSNERDDDELQYALEKIRSISQYLKTAEHTKKPFDMIGQYVAKELRQLPYETAIGLQCQIYTLIKIATVNRDQ